MSIKLHMFASASDIQTQLTGSLISFKCPTVQVTHVNVNNLNVSI